MGGILAEMAAYAPLPTAIVLVLCLLAIVGALGVAFVRFCCAARNRRRRNRC